ncbi:ABC transporter ATP-binding protein YxdL [Microbulbifer aestuariivivens]|uniref:ABC transporter ATP-binding protein YxdL n=1 Tax=Microbulbifer aestuariivivens TaxID=1908308 RepID=A0ABP9WSB2_9GAMM
MTVLLELEQCRLSYPGQGRGEPEQLALNIDHLRIRAGERVAVLGKSGSGKSTLLRHLRRQLPQRASWCPQDPSLVPQLKVFHNIFSGALARHSALVNLRNLLLPAPRFREEIAALAAPLGIDDLLWRKSAELSGGQQQRTAIARALYQRRDVLLADEPVSALDRVQGRAILQLLLNAHHSSVIALHNAPLALELCDRIIGLKGGQLLFDCPASDADADAIQRLYQ